MLKPLVLALLGALAIQTAWAAPYCPSGFPLRSGSKCYRYVGTAVTYANATATCANLMGALASPSSANEWTSLLNSANSALDNRIWTGYEILDLHKVVTSTGEWLHDFSDGSFGIFDPSGSGLAVGDTNRALVVHRVDDLGDHAFESKDFSDTYGFFCEYVGPVCPENFRYHRGSCFQTISGEADALAARTKCEESTNAAGVPFYGDGSLINLRTVLTDGGFGADDAPADAYFDALGAVVHCDGDFLYFEGHCYYSPGVVARADVDTACPEGSTSLATLDYTNYYFLRAYGKMQNMDSFNFWIDHFGWPPEEENKCDGSTAAVISADIPEKSESCDDDKHLFCVRPPNLIDEMAFYADNTMLCETKPFLSDITCDFESASWNRGYCNWQQSYESSSPFQREYAEGSTDRKRWSVGNHYLTSTGTGKLTLVSTAQYQCYELLHSMFSLDYVLEGGQGRIALYADKETKIGGMLEMVELSVLTDDQTSWTSLNILNICDSIQDSIAFWKLRIVVTLNALESLVKLDNFGVCSFYSQYDSINGACHSIFTESAGMTHAETEEKCAQTSFSGINNVYNENDRMYATAQIVLAELPQDMDNIHMGLITVNNALTRPFYADGSKSGLDTSGISDADLECTYVDASSGSIEIKGDDCSTFSAKTAICSTHVVLEADQQFGRQGYIGCVSHDNSFTSGGSSDEMAVQLCVETCRAMDKKIALLKSDKCYCENSTAQAEFMPTALCTYGCAGNEFQKCGGSTTDSAYDVDSFPSFAESCEDFYKAGLIAEAGTCRSFKFVDDSLNQCCYGNNGEKCSGSAGNPGFDNFCWSIEVEANDGNGAPVSTASMTCQNQGGHLLQVHSQEQLDHLTDALLYDPAFQSVMTGAVFHLGVFKNSLLSFTAISSGIKEFPNSVTNAAADESLSCLGLRVKNANMELELISLGCHELAHFVCEYTDDAMPSFKASDTDLLLLYKDLAEGDVMDGFDSPFVSQTACLVFCKGKGETAVLQGTSCTCLKPARSELNFNYVSDLRAVPCPHNPTQVCGATDLTNTYPVVASLSNMDDTLYNYGSCEDLEAVGIYINGDYKFTAEATTCSFWDTPCSSDELFFKGSCLTVSGGESDFNSISCSTGDHFESAAMGTQLEALTGTGAADIWGAKGSDGTCLLSNGFAMDCATPKKYVCARKVCPADQTLFGSYCTKYFSGEAGDHDAHMTTCSDEGRELLVGDQNVDANFFMIRSAFYLSEDSAKDASKLLHVQNTACTEFSADNDDTHFGEKACDSGATEHFCFHTVTCPPGSVRLGKDSCLVAYPGDNSKTSEDFCPTVAGSIPSFEDETETKAAIDALKASMGIGSIDIHVGLSKILYSPYLAWSNGRYVKEDDVWFATDTWTDNSHQPHMSSDDYSVTYKTADPADYHICEHSTKRFCSILEDYAAAAGVDAAAPLIESETLSPHDCIQHCKTIDEEFAAVWMESNVVKCLCSSGSEGLDYNGECTTSCHGQYCGDDAVSPLSVAIYPTSSVSIESTSCQELFLDTMIGLGTEEQKIAAEDGQAQNVECKFDDISICQYPLLKETGITVAIDEVEFPDYASVVSHLKLWREPADNIPPGYTIVVSFENSMKIRHFYTSWKIDSVKVTPSSGDPVFTVQKADDSGTWTFDGSTDTPVVTSLPEPIIVSRIEVEISRAVGQSVLIFDILGCSGEDPNAFVPDESAYKHATLDGTLYMIDLQPDIYTIEGANQYCSEITPTDNGQLASLDSKEKLDLVFAQLSNDKKYLIGLQKIEGQWMYNNGKPLGQYLPWDLYEPAPDKDCASLDPVTGKFIAISCTEPTSAIPICAANDPRETGGLQSEIECAIMDPNWDTKTATDLATCKVACRDGQNAIGSNYHWAVYTEDTCYCVQYVEKGFFVNCGSDEGVLLHRFESSKCSMAEDYPEKFLYIRKSHPEFRKDSTLRYECQIGYATDADPTALEFTCNSEVAWSGDLTALAACTMATCQATVDTTVRQGWETEYNLEVASDSADPAQGSKLTVSCPTYFKTAATTEEPDKFEAQCMGDSTWEVSEERACSVLDEDAKFSCAVLNLVNMSCFFPTCELDPQDALETSTSTVDPADPLVDDEWKVGDDVLMACEEVGKTYNYQGAEAQEITEINALCRYDAIQEASKWRWHLTPDDDSPIYTAPTCEYHCPNAPPPAIDERMDRLDWNGDMWESAAIRYKCLNKLEFTRGGVSIGTELNMKCIHDAELGENHWHWQDPDTPDNWYLDSTFPSCETYCKEDPKDAPENANVTWNEEHIWVGSKATYRCNDSTAVFKSRVAIFELEATCRERINSQNVPVGYWAWDDGDVESTDIPECSEAPKCGPFYEQFKSKISPYEPDKRYFGYEGRAFLAFKGEFNETIEQPVAAKVTLEPFLDYNHFILDQEGLDTAEELEFFCNYEPATAEAEESLSWKRYDDPNDETSELVDTVPSTKAMCPTGPHEREDLALNWNENRLVGAKASYRCKEPGYFSPILKTVCPDTNETCVPEIIKTDLFWEEFSANCSQLSGLEPWWTDLKFAMGECELVDESDLYSGLNEHVKCVENKLLPNTQ